MTTDSIFFTHVPSPVGDLLLLSDAQALVGLYMIGATYAPPCDPSWHEEPDAPPLRRTRTELEEYFAGRRTKFDVALAPRGTPFQQSVWRALTTIPHGTTTTYGAIARQIGQPHAARAVGAANGRNPISVVIPCHRVIGTTGALVGYAGGERKKRWLLDLEGANRNGFNVGRAHEDECPAAGEARTAGVARGRRKALVL